MDDDPARVVGQRLIEQINAMAAEAVKSSGIGDILRQATEATVGDGFAPAMQQIIAHAAEQLRPPGDAIIALAQAIESEEAFGLVVAQVSVVGEVEIIATGEVTAAPIGSVAALDWVNLWGLIYGTVLATLASERGDVVDSVTIATATIISMAILRAIIQHRRR